MQPRRRPRGTPSSLRTKAFTRENAGAARSSSNPISIATSRRATIQNSSAGRLGAGYGPATKYTGFWNGGIDPGTAGNELTGEGTVAITTSAGWGSGPTFDAEVSITE